MDLRFHGAWGHLNGCFLRYLAVGMWLLFGGCAPVGTQGEVTAKSVIGFLGVSGVAHLVHRTELDSNPWGLGPISRVHFFDDGRQFVVQGYEGYAAYEAKLTPASVVSTGSLAGRGLSAGTHLAPHRGTDGRQYGVAGFTGSVVRDWRIESGLAVMDRQSYLNLLSHRFCRVPLNEGAFEVLENTCIDLRAAISTRLAPGSIRRNQSGSGRYANIDDNSWVSILGAVGDRALLSFELADGLSEIQRWGYVDFGQQPPSFTWLDEGPTQHETPAGMVASFEGRIVTPFPNIFETDTEIARVNAPGMFVIDRELDSLGKGVFTKQGEQILQFQLQGDDVTLAPVFSIPGALKDAEVRMASTGEFFAKTEDGIVFFSKNGAPSFLLKDPGISINSWFAVVDDEFVVVVGKEWHGDRSPFVHLYEIERLSPQARARCKSGNGREIVVVEANPVTYEDGDKTRDVPWTQVKDLPLQTVQTVWQRGGNVFGTLLDARGELDVMVGLLPEDDDSQSEGDKKPLLPPRHFYSETGEVHSDLGTVMIVANELPGPVPPEAKVFVRYRRLSSEADEPVDLEDPPFATALICTNN